MITSRRIKNEIEKNGILTSGVVSRIEEDADPEDADLTYYVRYRTQEGEETEGVLLNPASDLEIGQEIRVKYHPKLKNNCRMV